MRGFLLFSVLAGAATVASIPATAADTCDAATSQSAMDECYGKAFKAADHTLNVDYRKIEERLADDPDAKKLLVAAQRAWVAWRDAECKFSASAVEGGSIHPMTVAICMTDLTTVRNADFARYLSCEEGDTSCPVPAAGP